MRVILIATLVAQLMIPAQAADLSDGAIAYLLGDDAKAESILDPLAGTRDATAQLLLGRLYANRLSPLHDCARANHWLAESARNGNREAPLYLARMYAEGNCVEQSEDAALAWYEVAAKNGDPDAANEIGEIYLNGEKVGRDYFKAAAWFRVGAQQLSGKAFFNLGMMYARGLGRAPDNLEAYKWFDIAVRLAPKHSQTHMNSLRERDQIREELTPMQVARAASMAATQLAQILANLQTPVESDQPS